MGSDRNIFAYEEYGDNPDHNVSNVKVGLSSVVQNPCTKSA